MNHAPWTSCICCSRTSWSPSLSLIELTVAPQLPAPLQPTAPPAANLLLIQQPEIQSTESRSFLEEIGRTSLKRQIWFSCASSYLRTVKTQPPTKKNRLSFPHLVPVWKILIYVVFPNSYCRHGQKIPNKWQQQEHLIFPNINLISC